MSTVLNLVNPQPCIHAPWMRARRKYFCNPGTHVTMFLVMEKSMHSVRAARARVSVNFRKFSPCIAPARRARGGLTVYPPSRTLEHLAFNEYCRFDTSAFVKYIKRGSVYILNEIRSIKTAIFIES